MLEPVTKLQTVTNRAFDIGTVVVLKSGSASMVVSGYKNDKVVCVIMGHSGPEDHEFNAKMLETMDDHADRMIKLHDRGCTHNPNSPNYERPSLWRRILNVFF